MVKKKIQKKEIVKKTKSIVKKTRSLSKKKTSYKSTVNDLVRRVAVYGTSVRKAIDNFDARNNQYLIKQNSFTLEYKSFNQSLVFKGAFRIVDNKDFNIFLELLLTIHKNLKKDLIIDFKRLRNFNSLASYVFVSFLNEVSRKKSKLKIKMLVPKILHDSIRYFGAIAGVGKVNKNVEYCIYDEEFYGGQSMMENEGFAETLSNQSNLLWEQEKKVLDEHGLKKGMKVLDVCCGIGDFVFSVAKEFIPSSVSGVDHSSDSISFARGASSNLGYKNLDFFVGDATTLSFVDNEFDFVSCRLSLQIFPNPDLILKEMYRIVKPGGRVYIVNEDYGLMISSHYPDQVTELYTILQVLSKKNTGMDFNIGRLNYSLLANLGLKDIKVSTIDVNTINSNRNDYKKIVNSWKGFYLNKDTKKKLFKGNTATYNKVSRLFDKNLSAIDNQYSYCCWPLIVASGTKKIKL